MEDADDAVEEEEEEERTAGGGGGKRNRAESAGTSEASFHNQSGGTSEASFRGQSGSTSEAGATNHAAFACELCTAAFPSRNALFKHYRSTLNECGAWCAEQGGGATASVAP